MTTARDIVTRALEHLGVVGSGESAGANDADLALRALRSMLDAWQLEPRAVVGLRQITYTPTAGTQSFTIGPAGNVVGRAPVRIEPASFYRLSGVDTPLDVGTLDEYNARADKTVRGSPDFVALSRSYDTATVYVYPAADGVCQLRLWVLSDPVDSFDAIEIDDTLTLPAGMQSALEWCLAEDVESDFSMRPEVAIKVREKAARAKRLFMRGNTRVGALMLPFGVPNSFDINKD